MMALTATAKIVLPVSLSISALNSGKIVAEDYLNAISGIQFFRAPVLPEGIADVLAFESASRKLQGERSFSATAFGHGLPPEVEALILRHNLQEGFNSTINSIKAKYENVSEMLFEVLADPDSDDSWLIISIRTEMDPDSLSRAYDNFVSEWVDKIEDEKRHFIKVEHLYS